MDVAAHSLTQLRVLASVLCLECGEIYSKPSAGGTVEKNPGCPECGYVGWIPLMVPREPAPRRSAAGPLRHRFARSR
jgi:DNA-directed RNA polymerase subunit RPC12/RpoP